MNRLVISFLFLLNMHFASAQVTTVLVMSSTPPAALADWDSDNSVINYIINNQSAGIGIALVKTELKTSDGALVAATDLAKASSYSVSGNRVYYAKDIFPIPVMRFSGSYQAAIERTGKLPSGNYQLTVQLVSVQGYVPLSSMQSKAFFIPAVQLPVLMKPYNNEVLKKDQAQIAIIFRWTPKTPKLPEAINYHIQAFEVYSYQQPVQAMRANQPILDETVKMQTQYIWRPQLSFIEDSVKRFIWTIQTLDASGNPVTNENSNAESRSEPFVFTVQ